MNRKKISLFLFFLIIVGVIVYFISNNISITKTSDTKFSDYTPQEEISDEQLNQTSLTLYFLDKETNQIKSEIKLIKTNELLKNPYKSVVEKLLEGPTGENLQSVFPENTRLIDANLVNNCVILNFSEELLNYKNDAEKYNIINCTLNSLTKLTEVNSVRFLVNNETVDGINEEYSAIS